MALLCETTISADDIRKQLNCILADSRFAMAERTAGFLRYVVEKTLDGNAAEIKEIVIATDLYRKSSDYDPKIDSVVRVEASRLRAKLSSYYQQQGVGDPVVITIPKGAYVPQFEWQTVEQPVVFSPLVIPKDSSPAIKSFRWLAPRHVLSWLALATFCSAALWMLSARSGQKLSAPVQASSDASANVHPEALAAWEEGNGLLQQDPHTGGSDYGVPPTLPRALDRFEYAVAKSPSFARGWASLAEAYEYSYPFTGRNAKEDAQRAEAAARRAVMLNDKLASAHAALALVLFYLRWDLRGAESEYRRALELDGRLVYAVVEYADLLRETGRPDVAELVVTRARAILPGMVVLASKQAEIELDRQRTDTAIATANSALHLSRNYGRAHVVLGMAYERKKDFFKALEHYRAALAIDGLDRRALPALGYLLGRTGRHDEARSVIKQLIDINSRIRNCAFQVAVVYAGLGEHEQALDWLEQAHRSRQMHVPFMTIEYRFDPLRQHPRFRAIQRQLGLETAS